MATGLANEGWFGVNYEEYAAAFDEVREEFERAVESYGLPFEEAETQPRSLRASAATACKDNGCASLWSGWISPACVACRTGEETATYFVSLKCTKRCYFCFNPNQEDYEYFLSHKRNIADELRQAHAAGARFRHLAVTGGEPCLHQHEVLEFVRCAKELYPGVHVRIYTSGDLLDDGFLADLAAVGPDEMRFSVKPDDFEDAGSPLFDLMRKAVSCIPDVMVEMPVIPGTLPQMKNLLTRLDDIGLRGINLLEFCFPLHNAEEFARRGFRIRKNPYVRLYNYWYGGGLPVAGSEAECLELLRFARDAGLRLGVHYCSLDNKLTGQIYQQNKPFRTDAVFAASHAWLSLDERDYFLKCAKVFGDDVEAVHEALGGLGDAEARELLRAVSSCPDAAPAPITCSRNSSEELSASEGFFEYCFLDESIPSLAFPVAWAAELHERMPQVKIGVSVNVLEPVDASSSSKVRLRIREVALEKCMFSEGGQ